MLKGDIILTILTARNGLTIRDVVDVLSYLNLQTGFKNIHTLNCTVRNKLNKLNKRGLIAKARDPKNHYRTYRFFVTPEGFEYVSDNQLQHDLARAIAEKVT